MNIHSVVSITCALVLSASGARAQCFDWEHEFDTAGASADVRAHIVFDDGSGPALFVGGAFRTVANIRANGIAKWDGTTWSALGLGIDGAGGIVHSLCVYDDGSGPALFVGGSFIAAGNGPANNIAKWDGSSWSPLGVGLTDYPSNVPEVRALATYDYGSGAKLFVGGEFYFAGGAPARSIASWDGANWSVPTSGTGYAGVGGVVHALCVFDAGAGPKLFLGGSFSQLGGVPTQSFVAWNGTTWEAAQTVNDQVRALAVHDDGSGDLLYLGVWGNQRVQRWNGSALTTIATSADVGLQPVALANFDDGVNGERLYVGTLGGEYVYAWDGSSWDEPLAMDLNYSVRTLGAFDLGSGEELFLGGEFWRADDVRVDYLAHSNGLTVTPFHAPTSVNNYVYALASFDGGSGAELVAGGPFSYAGANAATALAKFDGSSWSDFGAELAGIGTQEVFSFTTWDNGSGEALYVGGDFVTAGIHIVNHVARWDGTQFSPLDEGVGASSSAKVLALEVFDMGAGERLFAGGDFESSSGPGNGQAVARWNGSTWATILAGHYGLEVRALAGFNSPSGPRLVQGSHYFAGGSGFRLSQWNGSSWSTLNGDANGSVFALETFDDGSGEKLYAAGQFTVVGGVSASSIACWDGVQWTQLGSGIGGPTGRVYALEVFDDGSGPALYAGGEFTSAGGVAVNNVARWDGSQWSAVGIGVDGAVNALTVHDDGSGAALFLGGQMRTSGNVVANFVAKWSNTCACAPVAYCTSGTTSNGCVPTISGAGVPSASATNGFTISVSSVEGQKQGHLFYGVTGPNAASWGASSHFLCVKAPTQRTGTQDSGGTAGACDGVIALDWNAYCATHPGSLGVPFSAGQSVCAQLYFRDPPGPKTTALSNGLTFTVCP